MTFCYRVTSPGCSVFHKLFSVYEKGDNQRTNNLWDANTNEVVICQKTWSTQRKNDGDHLLLGLFVGRCCCRISKWKLVGRRCCREKPPMKAWFRSLSQYSWSVRTEEILVYGFLDKRNLYTTLEPSSAFSCWFSLCPLWSKSNTLLEADGVQTVGHKGCIGPDYSGFLENSARTNISSRQSPPSLGPSYVSL